MVKAITSELYYSHCSKEKMEINEDLSLLLCKEDNLTVSSSENGLVQSEWAANFGGDKDIDLKPDKNDWWIANSSLTNTDDKLSVLQSSVRSDRLESTSSSDFDDWQSFNTEGVTREDHTHFNDISVNTSVHNPAHLITKLDNKTSQTGCTSENFSCSDYLRYFDPLTTKVDSSPLEPVRLVLKTCFEIPENLETVDRKSLEEIDTSKQNVCLYNESFLSDLHITSISFPKLDWSRCLVKDQLLFILLNHEEETTTCNTTEDLRLSEFNKFDWTIPKPERLELQEYDDEEEGMKFSPDIMRGLLRGPANYPDTPIQIEFDYDKAILGLSMLTANELVMMRDEMATKVTKQSDELITLLQTRDVLLLETDAKNKFIAAFLRVQGSKHALQQSGGGGGGGGISTGGGDEGRPSSRNRSRSMLSLSKSFSQTIAWAKAKRNQEDDKTSSDMLLRVVIPYRNNDEGTWSVATLKQWTKILLAMADRNPNLPNLVSTYLLSEVVGFEKDETS